MEVQKYSLRQFLFLIFFFLFTFQVSADDDISSISAGDAQVVNVADAVQLSGTVVLEDEGDKKEKKHRKGKKRHHSKDGHKKSHKHSSHKDKGHSHKAHHSDSDKDDEEDLLISWVQSAGTSVEITNSNSLQPTFTAPAINSLSEDLVFTLSVSDDDGEILATDSVTVTVNMPSSALNGRVTDVGGNSLSAISIEAMVSGTSFSSSLSGANGAFSLTLPANNEIVLVLKANGYADQIVPVKTATAQGNLFIDITMIARGAVQSFAAEANTTLTGNDGASVSVTAGSFVDANGLPVTGNIDLTITPVDVSRPASLAAFPGEFSGVLTGDAQDTPIISFGTVEFEFSQSGNPLQLATGTTADVLIPIYIATYQDGSAINIGDSIPLWSLNEETGIWLQEGFGIVVASVDSPTGLAMQATVSHFSWWNCDVSMNAAQAIVTVFGSGAGTALIKARTFADIGSRPGTVDTVTPVGTPTAPLYIPSNGEVCFWADISFDDGSSGSTLETCLTPAPGSLVNVDLLLPVAGPVNITTTPADTAGVLDVMGYLGYAIEPVQVKPTTYETTVNYTIVSGTLPTGLSLNTVNATRADITGVVTETGSFSVVVQGIDADGTTDTVTINYNVTTDVPPPELPGWIYADIWYSPATLDLNIYNTGGAVTTWALTYNPAWEQSPPPPEITVNPSTGLLTISGGSCVWWYGSVTATNASGTAESSIDVTNCGGE